MLPPEKIPPKNQKGKKNLKEKKRKPKYSLSLSHARSFAGRRSTAMSLRPAMRTEVRKQSYKTSVDVDEARQRREDNLVEIRKNKREDNLLKKRREALLLAGGQHSLDLLSQTAIGLEKKVALSFSIHFD